MNWIVKSFRKVNQGDLDADFACEHVKAGDNAHVNQERDSFGIVGQVVLCDACQRASRRSRRGRNRLLLRLRSRKENQRRHLLALVRLLRTTGG